MAYYTESGQTRYTLYIYQEILCRIYGQNKVYNLYSNVNIVCQYGVMVCDR